MTPPRHPDLPAEPLGYTGAETTGFVSPAGDHLEGPIDLSDVLDLRKPNRYPVRVLGEALARRGEAAGVEARAQGGAAQRALVDLARLGHAVVERGHELAQAVVEAHLGRAGLGGALQPALSRRRDGRRGRPG